MEQIFDPTEIRQYNKLIAEFMGGVIKTYPLTMAYDITFIELPTAPNPNQSGVREWNLDSLCYHISWDWLMPAIKKAYSLRIENGILKRINLDIDITYSNLVEFIIWYNENIKL